MQFPVYVLSGEDQVPLPGGEVYIDIPLGMANRFRSATTGIGPRGIQKVVVVGYNQGNNWALMESAQALTETGADVGILCVVEKREDSDSDQFITLVGQDRVHLTAFYDTENGVEADIQPVLEEFTPEEEKLEADVQAMIAMVISRSRTFDAKVIEALKAKRGTVTRMHLLAHSFMRNDAEARLAYLVELDYEVQWDMIQNAIQSYLETKRDKVRDVKEAPPKKKTPPQGQTIPKENWRQRIAVSNLPPEHEEKVREEVRRWESLPDSNSDKHVISRYLDVVLSVPWGVHSANEEPIREIRKRLDSTHYGLSDIKEHVVEHMVIERRLKDAGGTVMCFVGPAGTGKTSIAKSIAKATGRELVQIAIGGTIDESELRGHRRTYVAAKAGRIVDGLRRAKTMDPIILLDEVDKIGPEVSSALLEILDPEQNDHFVDRYIELPIDLSKCMFICTANEERPIYPALLDRMEFLEFRLYTREERYKILVDYIYPRVLDGYNMYPHEVTVDETALSRLADEGSLRQIERQVGKMLRKAAVRLDVDGLEHVVIDSTYLTTNPNRNAQPQVGFIGRNK